MGMTKKSPPVRNQKVRNQPREMPKRPQLLKLSLESEKDLDPVVRTKTERSQKVRNQKVETTKKSPPVRNQKVRNQRVRSQKVRSQPRKLLSERDLDPVVKTKTVRNQKVRSQRVRSQPMVRKLRDQERTVPVRNQK